MTFWQALLMGGGGAVVTIVLMVAYRVVRSRGFAAGYECGQECGGGDADHVHDFDARGVEYWGTWQNLKPGEKREWHNASSTSTKVLWVCRGCEFRKVVVIDGRWTVEQLARIRQREEGFMEPWEGYEAGAK